MRSRHTALVILLFATLASCAGNSAPTASSSSCNYRPTASSWGDNIDLSQVPMVPRNPYWVKYVPANSPDLATSVDNPCAGQPGHVLFALDRSAPPLPLAVADY